MSLRLVLVRAETPENGPLAQLVEQQTLNLRVASSILARLKLVLVTMDGGVY